MVEVKFSIKKFYKCYRKCTKSRAKRLRPAIVHLLYVYVYVFTLSQNCSEERRTTYDTNTALALRASRGKNVEKSKLV